MIDSNSSIVSVTKKLGIKAISKWNLALTKVAVKKITIVRKSPITIRSIFFIDML